MSDSETFGEFLVREGIISVDALLDILMEQLKSIPTVCEIVYMKKLVSSRDILRALSLQSRKNVDFVAACKELGLWAENTDREVWVEMDAKRVPWVQVLVEKRGVPIEVVHRLLDSYLLDRTGKKKEEVPRPPVPVESGRSDLSVALQEFDEQFSESAVAIVEGYLSRPADEQALAAAKDTLHRLAGAALFAKLEKFQTAFFGLERGIARVSAETKAGIQSAEAVEGIRKGLRSLAALKKNLLACGSEAQAWSTADGEARQVNGVVNWADQANASQTRTGMEAK